MSGLALATLGASSELLDLIEDGSLEKAVLEGVDPAEQLAVLEDVDIRRRQVIRPGALDAVDGQLSEATKLLGPLPLQVGLNNDRCRSGLHVQDQSCGRVGFSKPYVVAQEQRLAREREVDRLALVVPDHATGTQADSFGGAVFGTEDLLHPSLLSLETLPSPIQRRGICRRDGQRVASREPGKICAMGKIIGEEVFLGDPLRNAREELLETDRHMRRDATHDPLGTIDQGEVAIASIHSQPPPMDTTAAGFPLIVEGSPMAVPVINSKQSTMPCSA